MSRGSLALSVLHTLAALWLAWLTVNTWGYAPAWVSVLNTAASICSVMAVVSESDHADVQRDLRVQLERKTRPSLQPPADQLRIPKAEHDLFDQIITAGFNDKDEAA